MKPTAPLYISLFVGSARRPVAALALAAVVGSFAAHAEARVIDVTGAPADGTTDAAAVINTALASASDGDVVRLPAGRFAVRRPIALRTGVALEGAGTGVTTLLAREALVAVVAMSSTDRATLRALTIDGGGTLARNGVQGDHMRFGLIDQVEVVNLTRTDVFGPFGVYWSTAVTDSVVRRSRFSNIGANSTWGVAVRVEGGSARIILEDNESAHTGRGGFHIKQTTDAVIRRNRAHDFLPTAEALGIEAFDACARVVIEDNEIDSWLSLDSSAPAAVRRNRVVPAAGVTRAGSYGLEVVNSPDVVMTDNVVSGALAAGIGVSVDSTRYLLLERNQIRATRATLVEIQYNPGGMRMPVLGVYSYRNEYLDAPARAVHPHGMVAGLVFDHDVVRDWGATAFFMQAPRGLLDGVTLESTAAGAQGFFADQPQVYVRGCVGARCPGAPPAVPSPSPLPGAVFTATSDGLTVRVDASASRDPQGTALHYLWDFGEGAPAVGQTAAHTFASAGEKRVVLIVWDADGWGARAERAFALAAVVAPGDAGTDAARPADDGGVDATLGDSAAVRDAADGADASVAPPRPDAGADAAETGASPDRDDAPTSPAVHGCTCRAATTPARGARIASLAALLAAACCTRRRRPA